MKIIVGILTYKRPVLLRKLLDTLPELEGVADVELEVVVVDNDTGQEGVAVCQSLPADYPFKVHASHMASSGISAVRNLLANTALALESDLLAFLDDDVTPEPQWLAEMLRVQTQYNADAVGGPVLSVFPENSDPSLHDNPYYGADLHLPDGSACQLQAGGNWLVRASVLQQYAPEFYQQTFAHSCGEDLALFTQMTHDGHRQHWAANARVHEPVPEERLTSTWMKVRVLTINNSRVRVMQLLQPQLKHAAVRGIKTCGLAVYASLVTLGSMLMPNYRTRAQMLRWQFMGKVSAHRGQVTRRGETD